jgi:hypothetical protein
VDLIPKRVYQCTRPVRQQPLRLGVAGRLGPKREESYERVGHCGRGHVERLIGSIRRECLDHVVVFGEAHRRRILKAYARNPRRCQRSKVSGFTMMIASSSDGNRRYSHTRTSRSTLRSRTRAGNLRLNSSSCWRRSKISASRDARAANIENSSRKIRLNSSCIAPCSITVPARRHADEVLKSDRPLWQGRDRTGIRLTEAGSRLNQIENGRSVEFWLFEQLTHRSPMPAHKVQT